MPLAHDMGIPCRTPMPFMPPPIAPKPSCTARPRFSVLVPTFNRAPLVIRALDSVAQQTCRDFEIIVVDDGSTDGTLASVLRWSAHREQGLKALWQRNAGVHTAYNLGVAVAQGELIVVLGSDDQLLPDALSRLAHGWTSIDASQRHHYCGIVGHGVHWRHGTRVGDPFPHPVFDSNYLDLTHRWRIGGDKPGAYRRDLLLRHPFPVIAGERFMRESYVLKQLALNYRTRYVDQAFQYFDYQRDGLSAKVRELRLSSPRGMCLYFREDANRYTRGYAAALRYAAHVRYVRHALGSGLGPQRQWQQIHHKVWLALAWPAGFVKWMRDCCVLRWRQRCTAPAPDNPLAASSATTR
jgi:glycosyltransferase involved in cell wall biosynthesis